MSKELGLLTKVVGMDEATITEKLSTPEGEKEISDKIAGMKIFGTNADYTAHMNNHKDMLKDTLYNDHKATVLEMTEKKILEKQGLTWKRGTEFTSMEDLVEKIAAEKVKLAKAAADTGDNTKDMEKMQLKIDELNGLLVSEKAAIHTEYAGKLINKEIDAELIGVGASLDVETEKLEGTLKFIKFNFAQEGLTLREKDGKYIVYKGDEILRDPQTLKEVPLKVVLTNIAAQVAKVKSSPAAGRGSENNTGTNSETFDFSNFKTWQDFMETQTELRKLTTGHPTLNKWYEAFRKSKAGA